MLALGGRKKKPLWDGREREREPPGLPHTLSNSSSSSTSMPHRVSPCRVSRITMQLPEQRDDLSWVSVPCPKNKQNSDACGTLWEGAGGCARKTRALRAEQWRRGDHGHCEGHGEARPAPPKGAKGAKGAIGTVAAHGFTRGAAQCPPINEPTPPPCRHPSTTLFHRRSSIMPELPLGRRRLSELPDQASLLCVRRDALLDRAVGRVRRRLGRDEPRAGRRRGRRARARPRET